MGFMWYSEVSHTVSDVDPPLVLLTGRELQGKETNLC